MSWPQGSIHARGPYGFLFLLVPRHIWRGTRTPSQKMVLNATAHRLTRETTFIKIHLPKERKLQNPTCGFFPTVWSNQPQGRYAHHPSVGVGVSTGITHWCACSTLGGTHGFWWRWPSSRGMLGAWACSRICGWGQCQQFSCEMIRWWGIGPSKITDVSSSFPQTTCRASLGYSQRTWSPHRAHTTGAEHTWNTHSTHGACEKHPQNREHPRHTQSTHRAHMGHTQRAYRARTEHAWSIQSTQGTHGARTEHTGHAQSIQGTHGAHTACRACTEHTGHTWSMHSAYSTHGTHKEHIGHT